VIGDVHGCLRELDELLAKLALAQDDRLVLLGDFFDRGPDPAGVVRRARELGAEAVLGNHDQKHLRWRRHAEKKRERPDQPRPKGMTPEQERAQDELSEEDVAWLRTLPIALDVGHGFLAVHGGLEPGRSLGQQKAEHVIRCWWADPLGRYAAGFDAPEGCVFWAELWDGPLSVVYGHSVHSLTEPRVDRSPSGYECYGLDTGCCYGGRLTAMLLEERRFVQVQAHEAYAPMRTRESEDLESENGR
jgi:bis(5'-nucleosyl)-tetraphosphatase (symmetrical)